MVPVLSLRYRSPHRWQACCSAISGARRSYCIKKLCESEKFSHLIPSCLLGLMFEASFCCCCCFINFYFILFYYVCSWFHLSFNWFRSFQNICIRSEYIILQSQQCTSLITKPLTVKPHDNLGIKPFFTSNIHYFSFDFFFLIFF